MDDWMVVVSQPTTWDRSLFHHPHLQMCRPWMQSNIAQSYYLSHICICSPVVLFVYDVLIILNLLVVKIVGQWEIESQSERLLLLPKANVPPSISRCNRLNMEASFSIEFLNCWLQRGSQQWHHWDTSWCPYDHRQQLACEWWHPSMFTAVGDGRISTPCRQYFYHF